MAGSASSAGALGALAGAAGLLWLMGAALASEMIGPRSCKHGEAPCFFTKMPCSQEEVGEHVANISPQGCRRYNSPQERSRKSALACCAFLSAGASMLLTMTGFLSKA